MDIERATPHSWSYGHSTGRICGATVSCEGGEVIQFNILEDVYLHHSTCKIVAKYCIQY